MLRTSRGRVGVGSRVKREGGRSFRDMALAVLFWLLVWQLAAMLIGESLFLASPIDVLKKLWELFKQEDFYSTVGFSFARIAIGFFASMLFGVVFAVFAYNFAFIETLFRPFMSIAKAAPAASFTIIFFLMVGSKNMAVPVTFIMALPVFYSNILLGLQSVEPEHFEAAEVFGMLKSDRFRFIYLPYVSPFFKSSCEIGWGMAWKAGVSAEVVAITIGSIGGKIYDAKIHLETAELFAYTFVVIAIALILERITVKLVRLAEHLMTK